MRERAKQYNEYWGDLWSKHKVWIILLIITLLFDTMTTIRFMIEDGIHVEIHPLVKYSALFMGPVVGTLLSAFCYKIIVSLLLAMYLRRLQLWILVLPTITSAFAGFYNLFIT